MPEDVATHLLLQKHWGQRIRNERDARDLSQIALGERAHLDQAVVSKIERGIYRLTAEHMIAIAAALEMELEELFSFPPGLVSRENYRRQIGELEKARKAAEACTAATAGAVA